jgi:predicted transposase YbfD/YdcC
VAFLARRSADLPHHAPAHNQRRNFSRDRAAITSLTRLRANAGKLLELSRQHWSIENRLHYVRDVSMGEDACRVRSGHAPQLLALLRNTAIGLVRRRTRHKFIPDALRRFIADPFAALALILPISERHN